MTADSVPTIDWVTQLPGNALDVVLVVAGVLFALSGYRQGFVLGVLSFAGFLGGGLLGARIAPDVAAWGPLADFPPAALGLAIVFVVAVVGQVLATVVGSALRRRLTWRPARQLDALGGAVVGVISLLLVAWLVGRAVASSAYPSLASQVRRSVVITTVDGLVPDSGRRIVAGFWGLVDERDFPEVFSGLRAVGDVDVPPPDAALRSSEAVRRAQPGVLKVTGVAEECRRSVGGSGFVYAPNRVMTNAHVVAGVDDPDVEVAGRSLDATVVLFDPERDIAVLAVEDLGVRPLEVASEPARREEDAVVLGYPEDGPFRADPARVVAQQRAQGEDIYQESTVVREIYAFKGRVRRGNSGGPFVDTTGSVLGVVFAAAADDPTIGYALTWEEVAVPAQQGIARLDPVSTGDCS